MRKKPLFFGFLGFWIFLAFFKFGAGLHYALLAPLGERIMPIWLIGLIISIAAGIQMMFDVPAGRLLDKVGYKKLLIICTVVFIGAGALLFWGISRPTLIASIALSVFGWLFYSPGGNAYILSNADKARSEKFMAYRDVSTSIGIVLSCVVLSVVIQSASWLMAVTISGCLLIALIGLLFSPNDKRRVTKEDDVHHRTPHQKLHVWKNLFSAIQKLNPASMLLILLNLSSAIFYGIVWFVVPLVMEANPEQSSLLGIGMSMFDFAIVVVGSVLCMINIKFKKQTLIFIGLLLFAIMSMLLGSNFGILFLVFAFLTTTGDELASLPLRSWLHEVDKDHNHDGLISGIINLFDDLGRAIGPLAAGLLYTFVGPQLTIMIGALPLLILLLLYYFGVRKHIIHIKLFESPTRPHKQRFKN